MLIMNIFFQYVICLFIFSKSALGAQISSLFLINQSTQFTLEFIVCLVCAMSCDKCLIACMEKEMATHSVFLPGESQGRRSLVGCCLRGSTVLDTTEATQQQQHPLLQCHTKQFHSSKNSPCFTCSFLSPPKTTITTDFFYLSRYFCLFQSIIVGNIQYVACSDSQLSFETNNVFQILSRN